MEQIWSAATVNLPGILLQLDDQTESEDGGYVSQSEAEVEPEGRHQDADTGDLGPPFLYFRLLEVFAQNWVPFWSPFLEFLGPLDILEQCNGRDFNNECFQSIVIVKNGWGEFWPALRKWFDDIILSISK